MILESKRQDTINHRLYQKSTTVKEYLFETKGLFPGERNIIERHKSDIAGRPVLDIGVGTGRTTAAMLELTDEYLGIDWSEPMIEGCKANFPQARFVQCDARNLASLGQEEYGFIWYSFNGLDCVDHEGRQAVILQVYQKLAPGGLFLFSSHNLSARGEKPWHTHIYRWDRHPRTIVRSLKLMAKGLMNYARYRHLHVEGNCYAILTDSGHEFSVLHYYADPADQLRKLRGAGFVDVQSLSWSGEALPPTHPGIRQAPHVYFLARKPKEGTAQPRP